MPKYGEKWRLECRLAEERRLREFSETALEAQSMKVMQLECYLGASKDENRRLEICVAEEQRLREFSESALVAQSSRVFSLECHRDAALAAVQEKVREVEHMRKYVEDDRKKRDRGPKAIAASLQADVKKLLAERDELKQKLDALLLSLTGEKASLQIELDSARIATCEGKTELETELPIDSMESKDEENTSILAQAVRDATALALAYQKAEVIKCNDALATTLTEKENLEKTLVSVEDERDAALLALAQQKAEVIKSDTDLVNIVIEKRNLERTVIKCDTDLANMLIEKRDLERRLAVADGERCAMFALAQQKTQVLRECDDKIKMLVHAHEQELEKTKMDMVDMKMRLKSLIEEKSRLDTAHEAIQRILEEEKDKRLCQICMESPKDTISFPCLHLNYCFSCLEVHRNRTNTCPSCRTTISGSLRLDIWT